MSRPLDSRLPYLPGIDAMRAIAVLAVFLYHAGVGWMPGGASSASTSSSRSAAT